jgi:hypothetical protein
MDLILFNFHNIHNSSKCDIEFFNMMVIFGLHWKSKLQTNKYEISL